MTSLDEAFGKAAIDGRAASRIILNNPAEASGFSVLSTPMKVLKHNI